MELIGVTFTVDDMRITQNFTMEELVVSATANRLKIDNTPSDEQAAQLCLLTIQILQPLRDRYGKPIKISSGYRCKEVNKVVGGSSTSQHLKGEAADIDNGATENKKLFNLAQQMIAEGELKVGQLIDEKNYRWIHISLPDSTHNNQILHL